MLPLSMMSLENAYYAGILPPHAYDEAEACFWSSAATGRMRQLTDNSHKSSLAICVMERGEDVLGVWLMDHQGEGKSSSNFF